MATLKGFAQAQDGVWDDVIRELAAGQKTSHWMWFVFPQLKSLGRSQMARHFGITSLDEAREYLADATLGPRLTQAVELLMAVHGKTAHQIMGSPDDLKLRSSLTLFHAAEPGNPIFQRALMKYYGGEGDAATLEWLAQHGTRPEPSGRA